MGVGTLAWEQLQELVKTEAGKLGSSQKQPARRWIGNGRLALLSTWQVEATFMNRDRDFEIRFDRFGWQAGSANFEAVPGGAVPRGEGWKIQLIEGKTQNLWRLNGQDLEPERLAREVIEYLYRHYEKFKMASVAGAS